MTVSEITDGDDTSGQPETEERGYHLTPDQRGDIAETACTLWLEGESVSSISLALRVSRDTVRHYLKAKLLESDQLSDDERANFRTLSMARADYLLSKLWEAMDQARISQVAIIGQVMLRVMDYHAALTGLLPRQPVFDQPNRIPPRVQRLMRAGKNPTCV